MSVAPLFLSASRFFLPSLLVAILLLGTRANAQPEVNVERPKPVDTTGKFTFFAIGDAGQPGAKLDSNAKFMQLEYNRLASQGTPVTSMVFLGDNFYPVGLNRDPAERKKLVEDCLGPLAPLMRMIGRENVHAVPGNHDYYCDLFGPAPYGRCNAGNLYELTIPVWSYHLNYPVIIRYPVAKASKDSIDMIMFNSAYFMLYPTTEWYRHTDSLRAILKTSAANKSVKWRILFDHHPPYTFGEHGGYRVWDPEVLRIRLLGNCIKDAKDPIKYIMRFAGSFEDNCAPRYIAFKDTLFSIFAETKARLHMMISGHDHNLQLLAQRGGLPGSPKVFAISGAGAKTSSVRTPFIDTRRGFQYYAHPINTPEKKGESIYGFLAGQIDSNMLKIWFIDGETGKPADMGGSSFFYISQEGYLVRTE